jgi:general secretion pathway protein G
MYKFVARNRSGFTLVEILLVVVIIGILAGLIATRLSGKTEDARIARAKADIAGSLSLALDLLEQDIGRYPTTEEGLAAHRGGPGGPGQRPRHPRLETVLSQGRAQE